MRFLRRAVRGRRRRPVAPQTERTVAARLHPRTGQVEVWPRAANGSVVLRAECPYHPDPDRSLLIKGNAYFCHECGRGGRLTKGS